MKEKKQQEVQLSHKVNLKSIREYVVMKAVLHFTLLKDVRLF